MLLEFFGEHMVQPWRDIFGKASGLTVTQSTSFGFLIETEVEVAMFLAKQYDLINVHIESMQLSILCNHGCGKK